jgi:predicted HTH domain antitoxin
VSIDIPTERLKELVEDPTELQREVILAMYQARELTSGKARTLLGLSVSQWDGLRKERQLRGAYDVADLEQDVATLKRLGLW